MCNPILDDVASKGSVRNTEESSPPTPRSPQDSVPSPKTTRVHAQRTDRSPFWTSHLRVRTLVTGVPHDPSTVTVSGTVFVEPSPQPSEGPSPLGTSHSPVNDYPPITYYSTPTPLLRAYTDPKRHLKYPLGVTLGLSYPVSTPGFWSTLTLGPIPGKWVLGSSSLVLRTTDLPTHRPPNCLHPSPTPRPSHRQHSKGRRGLGHLVCPRQQTAVREGEQDTHRTDLRRGTP